MTKQKALTRSIHRLIRLVWVLIFGVLISIILYITDGKIEWLESGPVQNIMQGKSVSAEESGPNIQVASSSLWQAPDTSSIPDTEDGDLIRYGRELITHTSVYLGPKGKVANISNGLNCQNCHTKAGTVPYGNNFGKVAATYPHLRNRSGTMIGFTERVNGCMKRSMNGQKLDEDSREMKAMIAYMKWVGKDVEDEKSYDGFGMIPLETLDRPADPVKGEEVYKNYCARCHGDNGEGQLAESGLEWTYPPLYGEDSYNIGAGMYRIGKFASFVKYNMPYGVTYENPFLTDEEAWDVAAFINSVDRPEIDLSGDWPDISRKPIDHPFGPYADGFSEEQHKYGPFGPIKEAYQ